MKDEKTGVQVSKDNLKKKTITIKLQQSDLIIIKNLASLEGIPYQNLIGSILHRYVNGTLKRVD